MESPASRLDCNVSSSSASSSGVGVRAFLLEALLFAAVTAVSFDFIADFLAEEGFAVGVFGVGGAGDVDNLRFGRPSPRYLVARSVEGVAMDIDPREQNANISQFVLINRRQNDSVLEFYNKCFTREKRVEARSSVVDTMCEG